MGMNKGDDPGDYTVDDVKAYLDSADQSERDRVLSAESSGKARVGVTEYSVAESAGSSDAVELGAKADTESAKQGIETQDAPGSKTHSTGVVTAVGPAAGPEVSNPLADPAYVAEISEGGVESSSSPEDALAAAADASAAVGRAQTEDEKLAAIKQDAEQQRKIAAAQGVDLDALRKAERAAAGVADPEK